MITHIVILLCVLLFIIKNIPKYKPTASEYHNIKELYIKFGEYNKKD